MLKVKEQLGAKLQEQVKTLSDNEEELRKSQQMKSEKIKEQEALLQDLHRQVEEKEKTLRERDVQLLSLKAQHAELDGAVEAMKKEAEVTVIAS